MSFLRFDLQVTFVTFVKSFVQQWPANLIRRFFHIDDSLLEFSHDFRSIGLNLLNPCMPIFDV